MHLCGVRLVPNGTESGWQREYFTYRFGPPPAPNMRLGGQRPNPNQSEPDNAVLMQIYRDELLWRIPKVAS